MRREFKKKSKVLLIDDNYEHLAGIRELLNLEGTFDVVGIATNVTVGLNLIKKYQPDVVLLDMNMPERDGLQGIMEIAKLDLDTKVLALSGYDDADSKAIVGTTRTLDFRQYHHYCSQCRGSLDPDRGCHHNHALDQR